MNCLRPGPYANLCGLIIFSVLIHVQTEIYGGPQELRPVTERDARAVILAIQDEIYAGGYQGRVLDVGRKVGPDEYSLRVYVEPTFHKTGVAWVIYKFMPYGEVYRMFDINDNGLAVLYGKPRDGFPSTQPSYLTVYMDDDELCGFKHDWRKYEFEISIVPSEKRVQEAVARQKARVGNVARERSMRKQGKSG